MAPSIAVNALARHPSLLCICLVLGLVDTSGGAEVDPHILSRGFLVVDNKGDQTLSIADVNVGLQVGVIPEDARTGHEVAISPDGKRAFVPIYGSAGVGQPGTDGQFVREINLASREIIGTLDFHKGVRPHCAVFGPENGLLYVTTELENSVTIINPRSLKIVGSIPTGSPQSHMLAITHDGRLGYTANVKPGSVSVLDLEEKKLVTTIPIAPVTQRIALSADDRWAFTADQTAARLVVIDTQTNAVSSSIPLPGLAFGTAATPNGRWLIAALPAVSMVALVDLNTMSVVRTLNVPKAPQEVLIRPDGEMAYVSCDSSGQIAAIDVDTWRLERLIAVGPMCDGLGWARLK
jgi:DNA-binding beta-propeller fold protein YncE